MDRPGTLLHGDEAKEFIDRVEDPITRHLLDMAFAHMVKSYFFEKRDAPTSDLDMLYLVKVLERFFSEHEVLARTLAGERVGAWFDEER